MALTDILTGLADVDVVLNATTIPVQNATDRPMTRVRNAQFRYLLPLSQARSMSEQRTLGKSITVRYEVEDIFIYRGINEGSGLEGAMAHLVAYMDAYDAVIWNSNPTNSSKLRGVRMTPAVLTYPTGSSTQFYGVRCELTIEEYI